MDVNELIIKLLDNAETNRKEEEFIKMASEINKINFMLGKTGVNKESCENVIRYLDEEMTNLKKTIDIFIKWYSEACPQEFKQIYG